MNQKKQLRVGVKPGLNSLWAIALLMLSFGCNKPPAHDDLRNFKQVNLVANLPKYHPVTVDPTLLNAFGLAWSPNGTAWVNSVGGHVSELYSSEGAIVSPLVNVNIPSPADTVGGFPCGVVFSGGKGFNMSNGPAVFLFTGFDGVLSGWNGASGKNAKRLRNPPGASYTGLAIGANHGRNLIYAANFGAKKIDVWDTAFARVDLPFVDPTLPAGYSPYNIQAVGDYLFVMYGELSTSGPSAGHAIEGAGKGVVSVFNTDGSFVKRFASRGSLDIPWGVTMAPASFLEDEDMNVVENNMPEPKITVEKSNGHNEPKDPVILVGNFGDGRINVYSLDGRYLGQLKSHNKTIVIDGLWALSFAPSGSGIDQDRLYFTAGPEKETDGLFGYLIKQ